MSEMVERVAGALLRAVGSDPALVKEAWEGKSGNVTLLSPQTLWPEINKVASAAIAAMREPTHMMLVRGSEQGGGPEPYQRNTKGLPDIWRDMIDAALDEDADLIAAGSGGMK